MYKGIIAIPTQGLNYIEPLEGSQTWYWGTDFMSGDLYEAEEVFRQGAPMRPNKLVFVHYPDGRVVQPVTAGEGQYFGRPLFYDNRIVLLMVDFPAGSIRILQFDEEGERCLQSDSLPLSEVKDCYNLMLKTAPLMLTRQGGDDTLQILWPERAEVSVGDHESFLFRRGDGLYFSSWYEDPEYREELLVRSVTTGEILDRRAGSLMEMPDGQLWLLT